MKYISHKIGSVPVLTLSGRFDAYEAPKVNKYLNQLLDNYSEALPRQVLINLSGVNFIDSTGLSTLVQAMKRLRESQGELYLSNFQQPVQVIFELTGLDRVFQIYPTEEMALKKIEHDVIPDGSKIFASTTIVGTTVVGAPLPPTQLPTIALPTGVSFA